MNWTPLLEGKAATQALTTAWEIAEAVEETKGEDESLDASLSGGHAGVALLHAYLAAATDSKLAAVRAEGRLDKALNNAQSVSTVGLFGGLAGVAWAYHHVTLLLEGKSAASETAMEEIDSVLAECLATQPWPWEYDLVYGLAGIGLYALDHPLRSIGESLATEVVHRLAELGEESNATITWKTKKELIHPGDIGKFPEGRYDLGMAHGVAGVVSFLARAYSSGIETAISGRLLKSALAWLWSYERPPGPGSRFPSVLGPDIEAVDARTAWCYGDPGIAAATLAAGVALGDPGVTQRALALAEVVADRAFAETRVVDAGLCHGAAGLAHILSFMAQVGKSRKLAAAARQWYEKTQDLRKPTEEVAGFPAWWPEAQRWVPDAGLLGGATGVAVALVAGATDLNPGWGRLFLLCT